jgi:hypothetical protein
MNGGPWPVCRCGAPSTKRLRSPIDGTVLAGACDEHEHDMLAECLTPEWIERELTRINRATALLMAMTPPGVM